MSRGRMHVLCSLAGLVLAFVVVDVVGAQGYRPPPYPSRRIRCESESRRHTYCRTYAHGEVRLERRLSKSPCREYDTWGADRDGGGLWVRDGCRAEFVVLPWGGGPGYGSDPRPDREYRLTCKSDRFRPAYCPLRRWGRVRLEQGLSDAPCRQYDTWGVDGGGIWVDRGCAATFSVR
jgi:Protein of unknown function (DUF3011)